MSKKQSLLWKIQHKNRFKGYVFGTIHVDGSVAFDDLSAIYKAIDQCESFATEIPLDPITQQKISQHIFLPEHIGMANLYSEKKYRKIKAILKKAFSLDLDQFDKLLPLFISNLMTQHVLNPSDQSRSNAIDLSLWQYADEQNKEMLGVEQLEDHIDTLYKIPLAFQLKNLADSCKNLNKFRKNNHKMLELYRAQDIHLLYKKSRKSLGPIKDVMLYNRNENMVESILSKIKKTSLFAAIGAGHLSGQKGIIHGLKSQGLSLKPVRI